MSPIGPPGRIVEWLRAGTVQAVLDNRLASEYAEVLLRPQFQLPGTEVECVLAGIRARAFGVEVAATQMVSAMPDPDDTPFLECALAAGAPLVTGNTRHYPKSVARKVAVLTPSQFVAVCGRKGP